MSYGRSSHLGYGYEGVAADAVAEDRRAFIRRTYAHVFGAVLAFVGLEALLQNAMSEPLKREVTDFMLSSWFLVLGAFIAVSWLGDKWAHRDASQGIQYAGLAIYVLAEVLIFMPLLIAANDQRFGGGPDVIPSARF